MTRTSAFAKVVADVLGREVAVSPEPEVSPLGAYLCARTALGDFHSLRDAASSIRSRMDHLAPDPLTSSEYQDYFARWLDAAEALQQLGR